MRVQLLGVPLSLGAGVYGADFGYGVVRSSRLIDQLQRLGLHIEDEGLLAVPPTPRNPGDPKARYLAEIADTCDRLAAWVEETLADGHFPLVVGGDHSISIGTVAGVAAFARRKRKRIGLIWIDAHGDMNTPETTPTGNVHGMPLATTVGMGDARLTGLRGFSPKVRGSNAALLGVRDLDPGEIDNIRASKVATITMRDIDEHGMAACVREAIRVASDGTLGFHVSLDLDALDPAIAPGVGTPVIGGLSYREAHLAMELVADSGKLLSLDVVEVNPILDMKGATADAATKLIASGLGKNILPPELSPMRRPAKKGRR